MSFFITQFTQLLIFLNITLGSLGWAIVAFTILVRTVLLPLTISSIKSQKKMREIQPELKKLNSKHKNDKKALQQAQLGLYKKHNINPLAGCFPQLIQIFFLIMLFQALRKFLGDDTIGGDNLQFFWMNLSQPDKTFALPIIAGVSQLLLSFMIAPGAEIPDIVANKSKSKKIQAANKKEENTADMAATMQQQMLFIMPLMTGYFAYTFASGIALYWVIATIFSIGQQYFISGWGGLTSYYQRYIGKYAKN